MKDRLASEVLGRDAQLSAIEALLEAAVSGPAALVLDGDAGIGKTTLWRAGLAMARSRELQVMAANPGVAEAGLAFAGLADLLEPVLAELLPQLPPPQRRALEIAVLMQDPAGSPPEPRAVASAFLGGLRTLAAQGPVVLAVDDLQWLDAASAGVLRFALRRLEAEPVAILLARRSADPARIPFELDRGPFAGRVTALRVGPLSFGAMHGLLRERLGLALPRPLLMRVHEAAGGNPFFALELARELQQADVTPAPGEPLPVPDTLLALVDRRISRLPDDLLEPLLVVAALSDPTLAVVEAAFGSQAVERLHAAAAQDLVEINGERIRFTHPLIGSGVYERAVPAERRRIHRLLADHVASAAERARQLARATDGTDGHVAAVLDRAAETSAARGAPEIAAELSEWARRLTPAESQSEVVRRTIAAAGYELAAGDTARARADFERALSATAEPGLRARARHGLARAALRDTGWVDFTRLLTEALEDATEPAFRCQIELDLASSLLQSDDLRSAAPHAARATELARGLGRPDLLAAALSHQAMAEALPGGGTRMDLIREGLAAAAAAERHTGPADRSDFQPELGLGVALKWADDFTGARQVLDGLRLALERREAHASLPPTLFQLAELECWAGDWDRAQHLAGRCQELAEQTGNPTFEAIALHPHALVHALRGQIDVARTAGQAGLEQCERAGNLRHRIRFHAVLGFTELSAGEPAAAREHLAAAAELASSAGYGEPAVFRFEHDHVESLLALGEVEAAQALVEHLEEHARALDGPWCRVAAARGRGLLSAAQGELDTAVAQLENALAAHDRLEQPFERARTLLALGAVQRRARQRGLARELLEQATAAFDELGAAAWAARAREDMGRLGGRGPASTGLTPAERQIADLVAEGQSNKEVAAQLFLTPKTVETQLTRIYAKVGVRSRTELAHRLGSEPEAGEL